MTNQIVPIGKEVEAFKEILERNFMPVIERGERFGSNDDESGHISVMVGRDGDVFIRLNHTEQVRFCTYSGGGKSPIIRKAGLLLALALEQHHEDE